jgi:flagellin
MIDTVATDRATVGANISVLGAYNDQLAVLRRTTSPLRTAASRTSMWPKKARNLPSNNILVQAGTAMLAQANATPQSALRLLQ